MRMGGYIKDIGVAVFSMILGMIVTFSWWGVNNLGVGLHSYGFTVGVMKALFITWGESVLIMTCGIPLWLHARPTAFSIFEMASEISGSVVYFESEKRTLLRARSEE